MGDMNIDYNKKDGHEIIKSSMGLYGMKQLVKKATRITNTSKTLIDVIYSTNMSAVSHCDVIPTSTVLEVGRECGIDGNQTRCF